MTPNPRRYLLLALVSASVFAILAILVTNSGALLRFDEAVVSDAYYFADERPAVRDFFYWVTARGAGAHLYVFGALAVGALLGRHEWRRALIWTAGMLAGKPVPEWFKLQFERKRPAFVEWDNFSFPSGHAFGSAMVYGMLALVALRVLQGYRGRWVAAGGCWLFAFLVVLSRPILGVHYPSDVVAGAGLGLAWGFTWQAVADWWDIRRTVATGEQAEQIAPRI